jgi:hypothetical protein
LEPIPRQSSKYGRTARRHHAIALFFLSGLGLCLPKVSSHTIQEYSQPVTFVDVTVMPMDTDRILTHQTVLVEGNRIAQMGLASSIKVPTKAISIDGRHRYLMPGLTDFNVHFPDSAQDEEDELKLLVANGITTAANMRGTPELLALRGRLQDRTLFGPTLYTTGPYISEPEFSTTEQVRQAVIMRKAAGYDFIKFHGELSSDAYNTLVDAAREYHIRVVGHVPVKLGIDAVLGKNKL